MGSHVAGARRYVQICMCSVETGDGQSSSSSSKEETSDDSDDGLAVQKALSGRGCFGKHLHEFSLIALLLHSGVDMSFSVPLFGSTGPFSCPVLLACLLCACWLTGAGLDSHWQWKR